MIDLKNIRIKSGKTQQEVADHLGKTRKTIQHWEIGKTRPSVNQCLEFFKFCGLSADQVLEVLQPLIDAKGVD